MFSRQTPLVVSLSLLAVGAGAAAPLQAQDSTIGRPVAVLADGPREGDRAPDFSLPWATKDSVGGAPWFGLSVQRGKVVVLAFYPKDFTSGCTAEMTTFAQQYADLFGDDVVVVGINADSLETHVRFAQSLGLPFRLLTDAGQKVSKLYGSAGDGGYNRRTVYVIDRRGRVSYVDLRFGALDPKAYRDLKAAIKDARR
jgi:thioredoxin-dependent peroxiredoxin